MEAVRRKLERLLGGHGGPTGDLYFRNACGDALADGQVSQLSPTVFASDKAVLVLRHGAGLNVTAASRGKDLIWLIDDDIVSGVGDIALNRLHRAKLAVCELAFARRHRSLVSTAVVSSSRLEPMVRHLLPECEVATLHPFWSEPFGTLSHFEEEQPPRCLEIGCLGAATHRADIAPLWGVFEDLLDRHPQVRISISANHSPPGSLAAHPRLCSVSETGWREYRAALTRRRFHITAYPLQDTPFNRARSVNKIIEHGLLGSAGVYSDKWPETARILSAGAGVSVPSSPDAWADALSNLVDDTLSGGTHARACAEAGQDLARSLNQAAPQRRLWARLMGLDLDPDTAV